MELLAKFYGFLLVLTVKSCGYGQSLLESEQNSIQKNVEKPRTLYDYQTRVVAYKDLIDSKCFLEILTNEESIISQRLLSNRTSNLKPISTTNQLSKREIWRLAGTRISDFCRGFPTYLIQNTQSDNQYNMQNDLPMVKISSRTKRDERHYFVGRVRGQTQSQYLHYGGGGQPGKAEAESSLEGTKAVVSGSSGMGQAQSQSSPVDCGECPGAGFQDQSLQLSRRPGGTEPEKFRYPGTGVDQPTNYQPSRPGETTYSGRPSEHYPPESGDGQFVYRPSEGDAGSPSSAGASRPSSGSGTQETRRPGENYPPETKRPEDARLSPGSEDGQSVYRPSEGGTGFTYPAGNGSPHGYPSSVSGTQETRKPGESYPSGAQKPEGTGLPSRPDDASYRPSQATYPAGASYPSSQERGRPGESYPSSFRRPENIRYPGSEDGRSVYGPRGQDSTYLSGAGTPVDRGYSPGDATVGRPINIGRPEIISYPPSLPSQGTGYPVASGREYPSTGGNYAPSVPDKTGSYPQGPIGPEGREKPGVGIEGYHLGSGRRDSGTFGGKLSGQYQSHVGHSGKFSGTFHGTYETDGVEAAHPVEELEKPGLGRAPGYTYGYPDGATSRGYSPEQIFPGGVTRPSGPESPGRYISSTSELQKPGIGEYRPSSGTGQEYAGRVTPGGYQPGQIPYSGGPTGPSTSGIKPFGTQRGSVVYPESPGGYIDSPSRYPGTFSQIAGPPEGYPSGSTRYTGGPSGISGPSGEYPSFPGVIPGSPGTYPGAPSGYPGAPGGYPSGPSAYPAGSGIYSGAPGEISGPSSRYPSASGTYPGSYGPTQGPGIRPDGTSGPGQLTNGQAVSLSGGSGTGGHFVDGKWISYGGSGTGSQPSEWGPSGGGIVGPPGASAYQPGSGLPGSAAYQPVIGPSGASAYQPGSTGVGPPGVAAYQPGSTGIGLPGGTVYQPGNAVVGPSGASVYQPGSTGVGPPGGVAYQPGSAGIGLPGGAVYQPGSTVVGPPGTSVYQPGSTGIGLPGSAAYQPGITGVGPPGASPYQPGSTGLGLPGGAAYQPGSTGIGLPGGAAFQPGSTVIGPPGSSAYQPGSTGIGPSGGTAYQPGNVPPTGYLGPGASGPGYRIPGYDGQLSSGYGPGSYTSYQPGTYGTAGPGGVVPPGQYIQGGPGATAGPGAGAGGGEWIDGKWVPRAPGASTPGSGQWINGQWVPSEQTSDDADSQVLTSVQQTSNETVAKAQAHGKYQGATAQSQVSGTYSGSGSFSASAGSDDGKRGALTQVSGGKDGAQSSAQGRGGVGQSQAQVSLDSGSGDTLSTAETSGHQHGTQTQVHASEKGGLSDAQANGLGPTSSQAQIGFTPYDENEKDNQTTPFKGAGTAAAQSGTNSGMTQTQVQGKFRFGIKYQGAAQAGSGSIAVRNLTEPTGFFKPINFTAAKVNQSKQSQSQHVTATASKAENTSPSPEITSTSTQLTINKDIQKIQPEESQENAVVISTPNETTTVDYEEPEYVDEDYDEEVPEPIQSTGAPAKRNLVRTVSDSPQKPPVTVVSQGSGNQKQHIILDPLENLDATVHQSKGDFPVDGAILQPGQIIPGSPGFQIPAGFRGRVQAIANGPNTYAIGKNAQAQSVTLSPGKGRIIYRPPVYGVVTKTTSRNGHYGTGYSYQPIQQPISYKVKSGRVLPNFVSVSKSEAGSANLKTGRKTPNVYYTQSSSCGMFTNSCVFSNGKKTCFPVRKTNPDGTPMSC